jgi:hypothetical protein
MKAELRLAAGLLLPFWLWPNPHGTSPRVANPAAEGDAFVSRVRPILLAHCAPCHEPGGVMYGKLPFDHPDVVASHSAGVLRRVKIAAEQAEIERWLAAQPKS